MISVNGVSGNLTQEDWAQKSAELQAQAKKAGQAIETFSKVNDLIRDPDSGKPSLRESLKANYEFNKQVLDEALFSLTGKGSRLNKVI